MTDYSKKEKEAMMDKALGLDFSQVLPFTILPHSLIRSIRRSTISLKRCNYRSEVLGSRAATILELLLSLLETEGVVKE